MQSVRQRVLPIIMLTIFIDVLGIGILIPVIPLLLADPASSFYLLPASFSIDRGYIMLGFLTAMYPFMQFLATPILGQLSDKYGRKYILAGSLFGTALSYVVFAFAIITRNIPLLFISRAFDGLTGGNIAVGQAVLADISKPEERARTFGLIGAVFGIGFIIGPFLGGVLSDNSYLSWFNAATPFFFAALLAFINTLLVLFVLPETHARKQSGLVLHFGTSVKNLARVFAFKPLRRLFLTNFLFTGGFSFFTTFFSVFLVTRFAFTQGDIGTFFAYVGIWISITQGLITRMMSRYFSEVAILRVSIIAMSAAVLAYFLPTAPWQLLFVTPFFAIFNGLTHSNLTGLISRSVGPEVQGEILGVNISIQSLANTVPPILSGFVAASFHPYTSVVVSAVIIFFAGIAFLFFHRPDKPLVVVEE